jgi:hypothetical protein
MAFMAEIITNKGTMVAKLEYKKSSSARRQFCGIMGRKSSKRQRGI